MLAFFSQHFSQLTIDKLAEIHKNNHKNDFIKFLSSLTENKLIELQAQLEINIKENSTAINNLLTPEIESIPPSTGILKTVARTAVLNLAKDSNHRKEVSCNDYNIPADYWEQFLLLADKIAPLITKHTQLTEIKSLVGGAIGDKKLENWMKPFKKQLTNN